MSCFQTCLTKFVWFHFRLSLFKLKYKPLSFSSVTCIIITIVFFLTFLLNHLPLFTFMHHCIFLFSKLFLDLFCITVLFYSLIRLLNCLLLYVGEPKKMFYLGGHFFFLFHFIKFSQAKVQVLSQDTAGGRY